MENGAKWHCTTCEQAGKEVLEFEQLAMIAHLKEAHGVDPKQKAKRRMTCHIDSARTAISSYQWTFHNGTLAIQTCVCERSPRQ